LNQYKRQDVFRCSHEAHERFNNAVSVYHVLVKKKCYPGGCIYFKWKCKKLDKGAPCPRGYKHVGRGCASCRYFYDIKVIRRPEVLLADREFKQFKRDLADFEQWLREHDGRLVEFSGRVNSVKPRFSLERNRTGVRVSFTGFLLNFVDGAVNARLFNDLLYVPISPRMQRRFGFGRGDTVECKAVFAVQDGSVVLRNIRGVEVFERGEPCFWTDSRARVALQTGAVLIYQSPACYCCERGVLVPVTGEHSGKKEPRRVMFCLEGIEDPRLCCYAAQKTLHKQSQADGDGTVCL